MLVRDPKTGNLWKTTDESWPRCSCGRCVLEDMEFPIYYGEDHQDPHVRDFVRRIMEKRMGDPKFANDEDDEVRSTLAMGLGTDECFNCGDVFHLEQRRWVHWEEPDIRFEITHYYRPIGRKEEEWTTLGFVTREFGTEEPFFQEFTTWRVMSRENIEDHMRTGIAVELYSPIHPPRGARMWMSLDGRIWCSLTGEIEDRMIIIGEGTDRTIEMSAIRHFQKDYW